MRILVLNYEFPPVGGGGARASAELSKALTARGHDLQVLTARTSGLPSRELKDGYTIKRIWSGRRSEFKASFPAMAAYILGGLLPGWQLIREWQPEVIHAHFAVPTGALAFALHRLTGTPYVLTVHLGDVPGGVPEKTTSWFRFVAPLTPPIWSSASSVIAVSEYTKRLALAHYDVEIDVIPNGIEVPESDKIKTVHSPPRLIFVGRFQPQKNLLFLVEALSEVRDLAWQCEMIGDGPDRARLEREVDRLELANRISFTGWIDADDAQAKLAESDLLVMPSISEGLPVTAIQALAHGVAIVAYQAGGLADVVQDGVNGIACAVGDRACFVLGLRSCLEDPGRITEMKRASHQSAGRYDLDRVAGQYEDLLEDHVLE